MLIYVLIGRLVYIHVGRYVIKIFDTYLRILLMESNTSEQREEMPKYEQSMTSSMHLLAKYKHKYSLLSKLVIP